MACRKRLRTSNKVVRLFSDQDLTHSDLEL